MKDISKISFEPTSVYFGYDYTLTEEGQAMLPRGQERLPDSRYGNNSLRA